MIFALILLAQAAAATPTPSSWPDSPAAPAAARLSGGFGAPRPSAAAGSRAKVVLTDETVALPPSRGSFTVAGVPIPAPTPTAAPGSPYDVIRTVRIAPPSAEEVSWIARASEARDQLARAMAVYDRIDAEYRLVGREGGGPVPEDALARRERALAPARERVTSARAAVDAVAERCRTTRGCNPNWVR